MNQPNVQWTCALRDDIKPGDMVRFRPAPGRWKGEKPRSNGLDGETALIIDGPHEDSHEWGGFFNVMLTKRNDVTQNYGWWMEVV